MEQTTNPGGEEHVITKERNSQTDSWVSIPKEEVKTENGEEEGHDMTVSILHKDKEEESSIKEPSNTADTKEEFPPKQDQADIADLDNKKEDLPEKQIQGDVKVDEPLSLEKPIEGSDHGVEDSKVFEKSIEGSDIVIGDAKEIVSIKEDKEKQQTEDLTEKPQQVEDSKNEEIKILSKEEEEEAKEYARKEKILLDEINIYYSECSSLLAEANRLNSSGSYREAEKSLLTGIEKIHAYQPSIQLTPSSAHVTSRIAQLHSLLKSFHCSLSYSYGQTKRYKEAIEAASMVIRNIDPLNDKCYAMIIMWAIEEGNLPLANSTAQSMKEKFPQEILMKYKEYFTLLEEKQKHAQENTEQNNNKTSEPLNKHFFISKLYHWPHLRKMFGFLGILGTGLGLLYFFKIKRSRVLIR